MDTSIFSRISSTVFRTQYVVRYVQDSLSIWSQRSQQRRQLREMEEHLLRDIGKDFLEAKQESDKPFWRA